LGLIGYPGRAFAQDPPSQDDLTGHDFAEMLGSVAILLRRGSGFCPLPGIAKSPRRFAPFFFPAIQGARIGLAKIR
jgi:hypothetical protein